MYKDFRAFITYEFLIDLSNENRRVRRGLNLYSYLLSTSFEKFFNYFLEGFMKKEAYLANQMPTREINPFDSPV